MFRMVPTVLNFKPEFKAHLYHPTIQDTFMNTNHQICETNISRMLRYIQGKVTGNSDLDLKKCAQNSGNMNTAPSMLW